MLIRGGWVSNSSSSSFIVNADLKDLGINCWKIPRSWYKAFEDEAHAEMPDKNKIHLDLEKDYWLTSFLEFYDDNDDRYRKFQEHEVGIFLDGQMGGEPYDEDLFEEVWKDKYGDHSVWVPKDLVAKCGAPMTADEVAAKLTNKFGEKARFGFIPQEDDKLLVFVREAVNNA